MKGDKNETSSIQLLNALKSISEIEALNSIGIYSLRDLSEFEPCRYAEILVGSIENGNIGDLNIQEYLDSAVAEDMTDEEKSKIAQLPIVNIKGIGDSFQEVFNTFFTIITIEELAKFDAFIEAKTVINNKINDAFYEKPSAPKELIPKIIGSTHTTVRYSNYVKEKEYLLENIGLTYHTELDEPAPESEIISAFYRSRFKFHLGYLASFKQKWINAGTHLGEIIHSIALAPGESRNIAFLEWQSQQTSSRSEDSAANENLSSEFHQNRALNEVVVSTAKEHLTGSTEIDASTKTTGYGITAGVGGGASVGASGKADLTSVAGFPLEAAGAGLASAAGSTGGSIVHSKSTTQGTLLSETSGDRTVTGEVTQNIADSTVQNSSNVRSFMSTVVLEDTQSGEQRAQTRNITNYNHSHALTMQYFEVLQKYNTNTYTDGITPVLYLPFKPINFTVELIRKYWTLFKYQLEKSLPPAKFEIYDQVIKDFNPNNGAFDYSGNVRIDKVRITRSKRFSEGVRVNVPKENPKVTVRINGQDMDKCLDFVLEGGSSIYVNYKFLERQIMEQSRFGSVRSFEIDDNIVAKIKSNFKFELEKQLKWYLNKDSGKIKKPLEFNSPEDNEIKVGAKRNKLIENIIEDDYKLINDEETINFSFNIDYDLIDSADNRVTVSQTFSDSLTFGDLEAEDGKITIFNATSHINSQLQNVSDINPIDIIEELENHFQTYKYGYTKYLINYVEKEQIIDVIEHLGISSPNYDLPLTQIIDPNPLGMVENLLIFKLKKSEGVLANSLGQKFTFTALQKTRQDKDQTVIVGEGTKKEIIYNDAPAIQYVLTSENKTSALNPKKLLKNNTSREITLITSTKPDSDKSYAFTGNIVTKSGGGRDLQTSTLPIDGFVNKPEGNTLNFSFKILLHIIQNPEFPTGEAQEIETTLKVDFKYKKKTSQDKGIIDIINDYTDDLKEYELEIKKKAIKNTVFLPTPGVFGEAILGLSNASEYINVSRFYNWQDSPIPNSAPSISDVNINENYSREISESINPNIPVSVLNQISPQQMPGTSLNTALGAIQNGSMFNDMSKTEHLSSTLKDLSTLANNTAQLAGTLSGEAAANALNAAVELGKQVAGMVNTAMETNVASPPETQTEKGAASNAIKSMPTTPEGAVSPKNEAIAAALGTPINPPALTQSGDGGSQGGNGSGNGGSSSGGSSGSSGSGSGGTTGTGGSGTTSSSDNTAGTGTTYEPGESGEYSTSQLKFKDHQRHYNYSEGVPSDWDTMDYLLYGFGITKYEVKESYMTTAAKLDLDKLYERMKIGFIRNESEIFALNLVFAGFSDAVGETTHNRTLRENRALSAFGYLSEKAYADPDFPYPERVLNFFPADSNLFVEDNSTQEGREKNRSVLIRELLIKMPDGTPDPRSVLGDWEAAKIKGEAIWETVFANSVAGGHMGVNEQLILDKLRDGTITDTLYFNKLFAIKYMSDNIYLNTNGEITPDLYALDFRTYIYISAVTNETNPEGFASDMRDFLLHVINPATGEVNKRLHLLITSDENISTVKLADFIRERQNDPHSLYYFIEKR